MSFYLKCRAERTYLPISGQELYSQTSNDDFHSYGSAEAGAR